MTLIPSPFALPSAALLRSDGSAGTSAELHAGGPTLVMIGHKDCKTTRQTLPFIDRIHKDGGRAVALMQDSPEEARALFDQTQAALDEEARFDQFDQT